MRPIDKRGNRLFGETWDRVYYYGGLLLARGYVEHNAKPNLFACRYRWVTFWADLRGTGVVRIWRDRRPIFWWQFPGEPPPHAPNMITIEAARLAPIPLRLSHRPNEGSVVRGVDTALFEREEPARVPTAPVLAHVPTQRVAQTFEALDSRTGELVSSSARRAGAGHLLCVNCRGTVRRAWNHDADRFYFEHSRPTCAAMLS